MNTSVHGTRVLVRSVLLGSVILGISVLPHGTNAQDHDLPPGVVRQDEQAAWATDIALHAQQTGLPLEQVTQALVFQDAFATYAEGVDARYPDQIAGVWVEPIPNVRGHIRFSEAVPPELAAELRSLGVLNPTNVVLTGEGLIALDDHSAVPI